MAVSIFPWSIQVYSNEYYLTAAQIAACSQSVIKIWNFSLCGLKSVVLYLFLLKTKKCILLYTKTCSYSGLKADLENNKHENVDGII